jgi:glycosyltransferase involved in cell wall biosynthesis
VTEQKISVIIPAKNSERTIDKCLQSVFSQNYRPYEVIVVDGGSTDRTREIVESFGAKVYSEPSHEKSAPGIGRNFGAKNAFGDIFAFLDSDCYPTRAWLNLIAKVFRDPQIGVYSIIVSDGTGKVVSRAYHYLHMQVSYDFGPSRCLAVKCEAFLRVNGFDEKLTTGEDNDLSYRIRQQGYRISVDKESKVYHDDDHMTNLRGIWRQQLWYRESEKVMRQRYPEKFRKFKTTYPLKEHLVPLITSIRFGVKFAAVCLIIKILSFWRHIH